MTLHRESATGRRTVRRMAAAGFFVVLCTAVLASPGGSIERAAAAERGVKVTDADFYGRKAIVLRNRSAEIVVVPEIGRVMRFGMLDNKGVAGAGPLWNHPKLAAAGGVQPDAEGWTNFGGDKSWPAPQSAWAKVAGRPWPPPKAFDATPYTVSTTVRGQGVQIVSTVDPDYGIQVRRTITLDSRGPVMTIETTYEKVRGASVRVGVWTITQLESPERLFIMLPSRRGQAFPDGYQSLLPDPPADLKIEGRLLSMVRDPRRKTMISSDGWRLLWVGQGLDLLVEDKTPEALAGTGVRSDRGARSQIYTSPGDDKDNYVELELLGRPRDLAPGAQALMRVRYTLIPRTEPGAGSEAKRVFFRP